MSDDSDLFDPDCFDIYHHYDLDDESHEYFRQYDQEALEEISQDKLASTAGHQAEIDQAIEDANKQWEQERETDTQQWISRINDELSGLPSARDERNRADARVRLENWAQTGATP